MSNLGWAGWTQGKRGGEISQERVTTLSVGRVGAGESDPRTNVGLKTMSSVRFSRKAQRVSTYRHIIRAFSLFWTIV